MRADLGKLDFRVGLNENANSFFATIGAAFGALIIAVSPVTAVHKAALCSQTLLQMKSTNHCRLQRRDLEK